MKHLKLTIAYILILLTATKPAHAVGKNGFDYTVKPLPTRTEMPVANVNAMIQDSEGYMWYATFEGGLCRDNGYQIDVFRKDKDNPDLITDNMIFSLAEAHNGDIWFSTDQCVYMLSKKDYSIKKVNDVLTNNKALELRQLPNGNMLVICDRVEYEIDGNLQIVKGRKKKYNGRKRIVRPDGKTGKWICNLEKNIIFEDSTQSEIAKTYDIKAKNILYDEKRNVLFALTQEGLVAYSTEGNRLGDCIMEYKGIAEIGVYGLFLDKRRNLWLTGYQPSFTIFCEKNKIKDRKLNVSSPKFGREVYVDKIVANKDGHLGIFKDINYLSEYNLLTDTERTINNDTLTPAGSWKEKTELLALIETLGLDTMLIKDATTDSKGHLWVIYDQFAREYNTENRRYREISVLGCEMGMNNFCCVCAADRGVCIGGAGGVCYFDSNELLDSDAIKIEAAVSSYQISYDKGKLRKEYVSAANEKPVIELEHNCQCLTLMLTSFNHINAQNVRFAIKVEGCGDDWVTLDMGENIFRIFNLDKGEYKVMLKATDENGLWGDAKEVAIINRLPAWWETWWAYTIYGLMTVGAIAGLFILYRYVSKKREQFDNMLRQQSIINEMQKSSNNSHIQQGVKEENDNATRSEINKQKRCELTEKAIAAVKANLDNEDYTVDMLANELCMSRVNLYRKMITICGQTPSEFMKTLRMEEAYRLLQSTDLPINIVAGKCGFTSSSYFAKCFKTRYGILPTDVRR